MLDEKVDKTPAGPVPVIGREVLTLLECDDPGKLATKRFKGPQLEPVASAQKCTWWRPRQVAVNDLWEAFVLLRDEVGPNPRVMLVRGELIDRKALRIRRKHKGKEATIRAKPRHLIWFDLDGVDVPGIDMDFPEQRLNEWLRGFRQLRDLDLIVHLSASWSIKPGVRIHLGVWGDRPQSDAESKELARSMPFKCDTSLYTPTQPHFLADPVFDYASGAEETYYGPRWFYLAAADGDGELHIDTGSAAGELAYWCGRIEEIGEEPRHAVINKAGYFLGRYVKAGVWSADELAGRLVEACELSGAFEADRIDAAADEIRRAIADGETDADDSIGDWRAGLQRTEEGKLKSTDANLLMYFRNHPALVGALRYNSRSMRAEWASRPPWDTRDGAKYPRKPIDADALECSAWLNGQGMNFGLEKLHKAFDTVAQDRPFDAVVSYLDGLPEWDGVERIKRLCIDGMKAAEGWWSERMGTLLIDSMVLRAYRPGSKMDTMQIFQNHNEGTFKSTFFATLVGGVSEDVFSDCVGDYGDIKHFAEQIGSNWLMEDGELTKLKTRESVHVMRTLSSVKDEYRPAFGHEVVTRYRSVVIVATTNEFEFLPSINQNRRLPALAVGVSDIEWLKANREQIFAEGVYRFRNGTAEPYMSPEELKVQFEHNQQFTETEIWEDKLIRWLEGTTEFGESTRKMEVSTGEIALDVLGISPGSQTSRGVSMRIGKVLQKLGWERKNVKVDGRVTKRYFRT